MRLRQVVRTVAVPICLAAAMVGSLLSAPAAMADPITDAQAQLDKLEAERSAIEDKYNESMKRLTDAQTKQKELGQDIIDQQAQLDALLPTVLWIVNTQRQTTGVTMAVGFLFNDSEDDFLAQMSTMDSVSNIINGQLWQYVTEANRLNDLSDSLTSTIASMQTETAAQKQLLADAKAKQDAQQKVLDKLTAKQRAALNAKSGSSSSNYTPPVPGGTAASAKALTALAYALKQNGKAYVYGGVGPNSYDCSGLTMMAYKQVGISLPHSAHLQATYGIPVKKADLLPGDLLFFYFPISHVGMYIGDGKMIHASNPKTGIKISPIESSFNTARRIA